MARTKGAKNKVPLTVKNEIMCVYEMVGGREGMARWARSRPSEFYQIYCRLAPKEIVADVKAEGEFKLSWDK